MKYLLLLAPFILSAQPAAEPCTSQSSYNYFAETGASWDYYNKSLASTTGFALRIGCSNLLSVTDIDTPIGSGQSGFATLRTNLEYHVSVSGYSELLGFGGIGATTNGVTTTSNFSGGAGLSYNLGLFLTKGKVSFPVVLEFGIQAITSTQVKPIYRLMFRKTF